jgi:RHS repeat-associated protein
VPGFETLVLAEEHDTDLRNELLGIDREDDSGPSNIPHVHDAAGNLVADGEYYYQYDAFNRLAAVYELGSLTFDADGVADSGAPGDWRASYAYDALGRRISRQVPWAYDSDSRWTWYYHDGVRRVMEVNRDPLPQAGIGGNPEPQGSYVTYADREYVWGPDYVDECLWQVDRPGATAFVLQDANYNVVALVDPQGAVLAQYDYDPYGQPIAADNLGAFGHNRIGHQGLFADRFDADAPAADLAVGAELLYYARNRDYQPRVGRWVQRDPNASGQPLVLGEFYGQFTPESLLPLDAEGLYGDGLSLYAYVGANPVIGSDPRGLFFGYADIGAATSIATDLQLDTVHLGLDVIDTLFDAFDIDDGNALTFARAGLFFAGFAKGGAGSRGVGDVPTSPLFPDAKKFSKAFEKHGKDFGVTGRRSFENLQTFERNIRSFMSGSRTRTKTIDYRRQGSATAYYNPSSHRIVVLRQDGTFWTAFKASQRQIRDVIDKGFLW